MFQPELFPDHPSQPRPRGFKLFSLPGRFLRLRLAYEDLLFGALALLLVVLGGFCLGVERGKQLTGMRPALLTTQGIATAGEATVAPGTAGPGAPESRKAPRPVPVIPVGMTAVPAAQSLSSAERQGAGSYVIQLASYTNEGPAREEVRRLEKRGVRAQVVPQGRYFEVRAVGFRSREEAKGALSSLRQVYRDAFLKRVG